MSEPSESQPSRDRDRWHLPPAATVTIWLTLAVVSAAAAWASYLHALAVVQAADGRTQVAFFIAGLADPAIFAASVNIIDASRHKASKPGWSYASIGVAIAVTLGANVMAGSPHSVPSWLVNVWPPVAFLMALESLMSFIRRGRGGDADQPAPAAYDEPEPLEATADRAPREWLDDAIRTLAAAMSERETAVALGISRTRVRTVTEPPVPELAAASLNGGAA